MAKHRAIRATRRGAVVLGGVLAASLAATGLAGASSSSVTAQPGSVACAQAEAALDTARAARTTAANQVEDRRLFVQVARVALQQVTDAATDPASPGGTAVTPAEAAAISTARENVAAAERNLADAEDAFAAAQARVATATVRVKTACAEEPTPTTTPAPTTAPQVPPVVVIQRPRGDAIPCNNTCTSVSESCGDTCTAPRERRAPVQRVHRNPSPIVIAEEPSNRVVTEQPPTARESLVESDLVVTH